MVMKSSSIGRMHILMRRSSDQVTSQALAWQTTSRSRGFVSIERSQNVFGSGSRPSEVKKPSARCTIFTASYLWRFSAAARSVEPTPGYGATTG